MNIKITDFKEQLDGSALAQVELDEEFLEQAVQYYVIHILEEYIKNKELLDNNNDDNKGNI